MKVTLGQPVIVENVTGAGGSIGVSGSARSAPDGYAVSIGHLNTHVVTGAVYNLSFDLLKDLAPVTMLTSAPMLFVARKDFPPNSLKEVVAWMKEHPKGASLGSVGLGSPSQGLGHVLPEVPPAPNISSCPIAVPPDHPGPDRGTDRFGLRRGLQHHGASARRQDESLCRSGENPLVGSARGAQHR